MRAVCFADFAHTVGWVKRDVGTIFHFGGNRNNTPGYRGYFDIVRQLNTALGLFLVLVLANQHALANKIEIGELDKRHYRHSINVQRLLVKAAFTKSL